MNVFIWFLVLLLFLSVIHDSASAPPKPQSRSGVASWVDYRLAGSLMANGKPFDPDKLTCASWHYPLGTVLLVTTPDRGTVVTVTDRGPNKRLGREIDLSPAAFKRLAPLSKGLVDVTINPLPETVE